MANIKKINVSGIDYDVRLDLEQRIDTLEQQGSGVGTKDYSQLKNKPSINNVTLDGNKTLDQLGIPSKESVTGKQDAISKVNVSVGSGTGTPSGSASVSGSTLNITLENIKGQKGDTGATGPSNNITIGTVTSSDSTDEASATLTGESPNQVLNLILPRGRQGNSGVTGDVSEIAVINDLNGGESEEGTIKVLAAEQGKILNEKISDLKSNINTRNKFLKGISDAVVQHKSSDSTETLTGDYRSEIIKLLDGLIEKIESVNYTGYLTIGFIRITKTGIQWSFYYYEDAEKNYIQSDFNTNTKHNFQYNYTDIENNIIFDNQYYSSYGIRIKLNDKFKAFVDTLQEGEEVIYDARKCTNISYLEDGITPTDVTNSIFNNRYSAMKGEIVGKDLFAVNDAIISANFDKNLMYTPTHFLTVSNQINIRFIACEKNDSYLMDSSTSTLNIIQYISDINDDTFKGIKTISLIDSYNKHTCSLTLDMEKLYAGINLTDQAYDKKEAVIITENIYKDVYPAFYFNGYFNSGAQTVKDYSYQTVTIPLNDGCSDAEIYGSFDKNANILLANENGTPQKWCILNEDGSRYNGDSIITKVKVDTSGYKYLVISTKGDTSILKILIKGYDEDKCESSFNNYRFIKKGKLNNIHLFNSIFKNNRFYTSCERNIKNYYIETEEISQTFTDGNNIYNSNCLIEIGKVTGTKFYYAEKHNNGVAPILWKEKDGEKTVILRGGDTIPIKEGYKQCTWYVKDTNANEAQYMFIKELSDGELLIGTTSKSVDDLIYRYTIYRTENNQTVWVPKVITSNEHYYSDTLGYNEYVYGYPTKNNSINIVEYPFKDSKTLIVISEYGKGNPKYWYDKGKTTNCLGVSGKVWASCDNGITFKKIFDFDEKINGDADDLSDNNWKWCESYEGRMGTHIHSSYIDTVNNKVWITNGDASHPGGKNSLYYINIDTLITWLTTKGTIVDANNFTPEYIDNEELPEFHEYIMWRLHNDNNINGYGNCISKYITYQIYTFFALNDVLLLGNDTSRQTIFGIHPDCITTDNSECSSLFIDLLYEKDKDDPKYGSPTSYPQQFIRRDENSPILSLWSNSYIYASWNGVDWEPASKDGMIGFASYVVKDIDDKYIICKLNEGASNYKMYKLLNY